MKRHLLLAMLLLLAVSLFIPNIFATTTNQQNAEIITTTSTSDGNTALSDKTALDQSTTASTKAVSTTKNSPTNQNTLNSNSPKTTSENQNTANIQYAAAAAGDSNVRNNWFTTNNIAEAAGRVKIYIETNHRLPKYVTIGTTQVTMPQFLRLLTTGSTQINKGNTAQIALKGVNSPPNTFENLKTGTISKSEYLTIAVKVQSFINTNNRAPNNATSSLGKIGYQSLIYMYSRIMGYQYKNKVLPTTISMKPYTSINTATPTNPAPSTPSSTGYTIAQISAAAGDVKTFVEKNQRLPNYAVINGKQITMPQFLRLLNTGLLQINGNNKTPIALKSAGAPSSPSENLKSGNIYKSGYINLANRIQSYMGSQGKAPNYANSTLGKIRYETLIYLESRILNFYGKNSVLPKYAALNPWKTSTTPGEYSKYLKPTANCQSNNQRIIKLAKSITSGKTSVYNKAAALFNWVRNNTEYSFYWNTKKGALGTLNSGSANCVDHAHLLIALTRAAGIPARYEHGYCQFADGWFGHVWAQVYVNGKWYRADAVSPRNSFGIINNWNTSNWTPLGIYAELPF